METTGRNIDKTQVDQVHRNNPGNPQSYSASSPYGRRFGDVSSTDDSSTDCSTCSSRGNTYFFQWNQKILYYYILASGDYVLAWWGGGGRLCRLSHFLAHITRFQFELEVGLMKIILSLN